MEVKCVYFEYGEKEKLYLKNKDKKLCAVIEKIGHIYRETDKDLFSSVVHHIIGQQISTKAQATIWSRMKEYIENINADNIIKMGADKLQSFGLTFKKTSYIIDFAEKVKNNEFDLKGIWDRTDDEAIKELTSIKGIGVWTAEMILLFCMERPNIFSFDDLAIHRGLRMIYHHKKIDRKLFEKYRKRFSPYCSVASLYLWAVAGGEIKGMEDYGLKGKNKENGQTRKDKGDSKQR